MAPGNLLLKDEIRGGSYGTFGGHAQYYSLLWIMLPAVLIFYTCLVLALVGRTHFLQYHCLTQAAHVDMHEDTSKDGVSVTLLKSLITGTLMVVAVGILFVALNLVAASFHESFKDCSELLHTSSACISRHPSSLYQYFWVLLSTGVLTTFSVMAYRVKLHDGSGRANRVFNTICNFVQTHDTQSNALNVWKANVWPNGAHGGVHIRFSRRCYFIALHVPLVLMASIPDFFYGNCCLCSCNSDLDISRSSSHKCAS